MTKIRAILDPSMKSMAYIPHGIVLVEFGRETYNGIPVPVCPERVEGDGKRVDSLLDRFTAPETKKEMTRLLHSVSRRHAILSLWGDDAQLMDAGSRNGVYIKGGGIGGADKKLGSGEKFTLQNRTVFLLGAWPLRFLDDPKDIESAMKEKPGIYRVTNLPATDQP